MNVSLEDTMKRSAVISLIASLGLLALSAGPASAAPVTKFDVPEECFQFSGGTVCVEQSGQTSSQETRSGVFTTVGKNTFRFTIYDGPAKQNLLEEISSTNRFNFVSRNGQTVVFHSRSVFTEAAGGSTCTTISNFTVTGSELRHEDTDVQCA
jgi:hypothetical protein